MCIISSDLIPDRFPCVHFRGKQTKHAKEIYAGFSPLIHGNVTLPFQRKVAPGTGTRGVKVRQIKSFNSGKQLFLKGEMPLVRCT